MKNYQTLIAITLFSITCCYAQPNLLPLTITANKTILTRFNVEIANTKKQQAVGLMFRKHLPANQGMLFIYQQSVWLDFWMKNTYIPLDILFINKQKQITSIQTMQPCKTVPCEIYKSKKPVKYALEINAGLAKKYKIESGDRVYFTYK